MPQRWPRRPVDEAAGADDRDLGVLDDGGVAYGAGQVRRQSREGGVGALIGDLQPQGRWARIGSFGSVNGLSSWRVPLQVLVCASATQ